MKNLSPAKARRSNAEMSEQTRFLIEKATIDSLAEYGYAGTTMAGIAKRVGVSRAALVYHYESKNALMAAVINAIYDEMKATFKAAAHSALTPEERIIAIMDANYLFTKTVSHMAQIELLLAARRDPEFRTEVAPTIEARDRAFREAWASIASELKGNKDRLDLIRDLSVSLFRGITISRSLDFETTSFDRQLLLMRKLLLEAL